MLTLSLNAIAAAHVHGIYGKTKDQMPKRLRFLHKDAAAAYLQIGATLVISDMFRSPDSSLQAVREGRGAMPPGYSAHNFGLAIDLDIKATMRRWKLQKKSALDATMEEAGWYCHRRDHQLASEAWHYNFLGVGTIVTPATKSTKTLVEHRIKDLYGASLAPDDAECQQLLSKLAIYGGEIDGRIGRQSREAIRVFQRAWGIRETGQLDEKTRRTLAYVTCERVLSD